MSQRDAELGSATVEQPAQTSSSVKGHGTIPTRKGSKISRHVCFDLGLKSIGFIHLPDLHSVPERRYTGHTQGPGARCKRGLAVQLNHCRETMIYCRPAYQ
jgi:hypothetical protein